MREGVERQSSLVNAQSAESSLGTLLLGELSWHPARRGCFLAAPVMRAANPASRETGVQVLLMGFKSVIVLLGYD